ncbi:kinase-like protein, partial [Punctularia strigosozonata HHB-11173 SS5]|uniref:kinase-like protein n=1 Tax=Punctularia strigosozonata (strain HHB-11173) TaxID=741275 RepID=UPI0004416D53
REALLWRYLSHPHVLPFYGVDGRTFPEAIALVSPWMPNGNIIEYLNRQEPSSTLIENLLRQIIAGLVYLHDSVDVVHGDLRGPNILIDSDGRARLGDFGLALLAVETNTRNSFPSGTARYMAPELHAPEKFGLPHCRPTKPTDIYALAFLVLELYTLRPPFADMKDTAVALRVIDADRPARPTREDCRGVEIPEALWTTVQVCWEQDFSRRPTIAQ